MKLPIFAAAIAILSTGTRAQDDPCIVCPGGINVDGDTETENGNTCGGIQSDAAKFNADDAICDRIKGFEELCCGGSVETTVASVVEPTEAAKATTEAAVTEAPVVTTETPVATTETPESDKCSVCPNGITVDADVPTEGNNDCGGIQAAAARFDADDDICSRIKSFESTCCPDNAPTTVSAMGTTETGSTAAAVAGSTAAAVSTAAAGAGSTAAAVVANATVAAVVGSTVAGQSTEAAVSTALPGSSCVVCSGGITAPSTLETVPGKTCADLLPDAARQEAGDGICELIQQSEERCCPVGGFVACSVCAGGLTVSGATLVEGDITCDDIIEDAPLVQESSDACTEKKAFEDTCCPAIITPTTTVAATSANLTEVASTAAASTVASTSATVSATEVSTTTAAASMTNSTITASTPAVVTVPPTGNENLPPSSSTSEFSSLYDSSTGFSVSTNPRYAFTSVAIVGYIMFL
eukprot:scaffold10708_cov164-Skeletonema_menzelii.AAC.6